MPMGDKKTTKHLSKHSNVDENSTIIIVFGLPGSGKSYFAERLAKKIKACYVNSDRIRKELFTIRTYSPLEKSKVYDVMLEKMKAAIDQNKKLILDATFHSKATRNMFLEKSQGAKVFFIEVQADEHVTKERLKNKRLYSEADFKVYQSIRKEWEALTMPHLVLNSTDENIEDMLKKSTNYLNNTNDGKADS